MKNTKKFIKGRGSSKIILPLQYIDNEVQEKHNSYRDVKKSYFQTCTQYTLNGYSLM